MARFMRVYSKVITILFIVSVVRINIEREHVNGGFVQHDDIQRDENSSEQNATIIGCNFCRYDVPAVSNNYKQKYLKLRDRTYNETIVILTPLRDTAKFLEHFGNMLNTLTYPHDLISVFFAEEGSSDNTFESAKSITLQLNKYFGFKESQVHKLNFTGNPIRREDRHEINQRVRRSHLSRVRNALLDYGMRDNEWVLWIDSDIESVPKDLIQQFLNVSKDVMAVACLVKKKNGRTMNYDHNTRRFGDEKCGDLCLPFLRDEGRVVRLDIVGTSVLMVRSDVHRKVRFPEVRERGGRLESEGFSEYAKQMGFETVGLPFVEVYHYFA